MASSFGPWADLPRELLRIVVDSPGLPLQSLPAIRGVCTAWLSPPHRPRLRRRPAPRPARGRRTRFRPAPPPQPPARGPRVRALHAPRRRRVRRRVPRLDRRQHGLAGDLPRQPSRRRRHGDRPAPTEERRRRRAGAQGRVRAAPDDCTAVAICGPSTLAYIRTRDAMRGRWVLVDVAVDAPDRLADLAYDAGAAGGGKGYCVTRCGDVHVFQIPRDRRRLRPRANPLRPRPAGEPFKPAAAFAPPYDVASRFAITNSKNVFICGGGLYQVWRRDAATAISWTVPGGGGGTFRMPKDDVVVLKYNNNARRRPSWDAVRDVGGCSVFVGKNNPVVLRPEDAPGVRANCVYWINERAEPMVFDMAARTSTRHPSSAMVLSPACRPLCWYFLQEKTMSVEDS